MSSATQPAVEPSRPQGPEGARYIPFLWGAVALVPLLMFAGALGTTLYWQHLMSADDLLKATELRITYTVRSAQAGPGVNVLGQKTITVQNGELNEILGALTIKNTEMTPVWVTGQKNSCQVDFVLPDESVAQTTFATNTMLNRHMWGQVQVTPTFCSKINEVVSRKEGRPINVLGTN